MGKTLNGFIIIDPITEEKTAYGMHIPGASAEQIRSGKAKVINSGDIESVKKDDIIFYDIARSFKLVDEDWDNPVTVIRLGDVIYVV